MKWISRGFHRKHDPIELYRIEQNISHTDESVYPSEGLTPSIISTEAWNKTLYKGLMLRHQDGKLFETVVQILSFIPWGILLAHSPMEERSGTINWHVPRFRSTTISDYYLRIKKEPSSRVNRYRNLWSLLDRSGRICGGIHLVKPTIRDEAKHATLQPNFQDVEA